MRTLCNFLVEATFLEGPFIRTHGRKPPPSGSYRFSIDPNSDDQDDRFWFYSKMTTYDRAKMRAMEYFVNAKHIYVMP